MFLCNTLTHRWSGDSQGEETFLAPSADNQTRNYDTECSYIYYTYIIDSVCTIILYNTYVVVIARCRVQYGFS